MPSLLRQTFFGLPKFVGTVLSPVSFGALALVEQANKVVLVRQSYAEGWHLPGGGVKRGEPPRDAVLRELKEEIGLTWSSEPMLVGLFVRRLRLMTNFIALYRVREARFDFKPNLEIREIVLADPASPPPGTRPGVRRRLAELMGEAPQSLNW